MLDPVVLAEHHNGHSPKGIQTMVADWFVKGLATSQAVEIPALFGLATPNQGRPHSMSSYNETLSIPI